jgi:flagellar biosynthetic protein FliS
MNYASESATGVTPLGLVIRIYENIVSDLGRAVIAIRDGDVERRTAQLQHALLLLAHLENALDLENGGEPARVLEKFYSVARACILQAQIKQSGKILEELSSNFLTVREAWAQMEIQPNTPATPSPKAASDSSSWVA